MRFAAEFRFRFRATVQKRRKWYLAVCLPLDLATQGPTKERALSNLRDAIRGFVTDCYERGTLDEVLKDAGFSASTDSSLRSTRAHRGSRWLSVPVALLAREHHAARTN